MQATNKCYATQKSRGCNRSWRSLAKPCVPGIVPSHILSFSNSDRQTTATGRHSCNSNASLLHVPLATDRLYSMCAQDKHRCLETNSCSRYDCSQAKKSLPVPAINLFMLDCDNPPIDYRR